MTRPKGKLRVQYNGKDYHFTNLDIYGLRGEGFLEIVDQPQDALFQQFFSISKLRNCNYANVGDDIVINGVSVSGLIRKANEKEFQEEIAEALNA